MAVRTLPGRIWIGDGSTTECISLRRPTLFSVTAFLLVKLGNQQPEATLIDPVRTCSVGLMSGFACQARRHRFPA
jgi:hypothetical protein